MVSRIGQPLCHPAGDGQGTGGIHSHIYLRRLEQRRTWCSTYGSVGESRKRPHLSHSSVGIQIYGFAYRYRPIGGNPDEFNRPLDDNLPVRIQSNQGHRRLSPVELRIRVRDKCSGLEVASNLDRRGRIDCDPGLRQPRQIRETQLLLAGRYGLGNGSISRWEPTGGGRQQQHGEDGMARRLAGSLHTSTTSVPAEERPSAKDEVVRVQGPEVRAVATSVLLTLSLNRAL